MCPGWHATFDNPPFHEFRVVLEARVKVLFDPDQIGDGHTFNDIRSDTA